MPGICSKSQWLVIGSHRSAKQTAIILENHDIVAVDYCMFGIVQNNFPEELEPPHVGCYKSQVFFAVASERKDVTYAAWLNHLFRRCETD